MTRLTEPVFVAQGESLVNDVAALDVRNTVTVCRVWREHAEAIVDLPEPEVPERSLSYQRAADCTMLGRFVFDPALATEFERALTTATVWEGQNDIRPVKTRETDALFDIFAFFNMNHDKDGTPRHRPHVEIVTEEDDLHTERCCSSTSDGDRLPSSTTDAYLCDSWMQRIRMSGSMPLDIGRLTRSVPLDMFRAVAQRDGGCRHPGCNRKIAWCQAHHVIFWRHFGVTALDNLVLLCSRHHHLIHRPGWHLKLTPDGEVEVTAPSGRTDTSSPRRRTPRLQI